MKNENKPYKIFFAHSGGGQSGPGEGSYDLVAYLRRVLSDDFEVHFPLIDDPEEPTYDMWQKMLSVELKAIEQPIILIGHSLGGSMLLKYLSEEKPNIEISAIFLIGTPLWASSGWNIDDYILKENFETELKAINKIFLYHSNEDAIVPFEHLDFYKRAFPEATVRVINGTDHAFAEGLPELVADIKSVVS